jgi:hypothetical protein
MHVLLWIFVQRPCVLWTTRVSYRINIRKWYGIEDIILVYDVPFAMHGYLQRRAVLWHTVEQNNCRSVHNVLQQYVHKCALYVCQLQRSVCVLCMVSNIVKTIPSVSKLQYKKYLVRINYMFVLYVGIYRRFLLINVIGLEYIYLFIFSFCCCTWVVDPIMPKYGIYGHT